MYMKNERVPAQRGCCTGGTWARLVPRCATHVTQAIWGEAGRLRWGAARAVGTRLGDCQSSAQPKLSCSLGRVHRLVGSARADLQ